MAETHWGLHGTLWTMVESLARAALRSGTMVSRSGEPRVRYDGPVHRSPACASFPPRSIAASPTRLVLSNPVGPVEVFGINTSGLVVGRSYKWEGECIDGPFGRTAFGRVTLTSSGSLLYLHDEVRGISTPMVLALPDVSGVAFDCHANVLVVASPTGVHAFDLVERDRAAPPSIELRWHVPYAAEAAKTRRLSLASGVAWLPDGRVVVEWLNGDRVIVDRRSGEVGPIDSTGRRNLHVVSGGPNRERVFSVGMTHMSRLDSVTLEPTIEIEHHMSSADVLALPSPSGSRVLVFGRQQHLLVLRADSLDIEHQHRTDGELYCADWIDDDTVAIAHSSGVDTLLLRQPLTAPTAAP